MGRLQHVNSSQPDGLQLYLINLYKGRVATSKGEHTQQLTNDINYVYNK